MNEIYNKIGILGYGNMGSAIGQGIKGKYAVNVFDKDPRKIKDAEGVSLVGSIEELIEKSQAVILAVKPQDFEEILSKIKDLCKGKLIISIAAGIAISYLEKYLGEVKIVRVMPNIAAKIAEAETALCKGKYAGEDDLNLAKEIFNCVGKTWIIEENLMNSATAVIGSGPAYICYDMEINKYSPKNLPEEIKKKYIVKLTEAAEAVGFDSATASSFATASTTSTLNLCAATGSPAKLREQITSKGGTTEKAIEVLRGGGSWIEAARSAAKRAVALAKKIS